MPGVVEEYVRKQQDVQEQSHEYLYWSMREGGYSPDEVSAWMNERVRENPNATATEMLSVYRAESTVAEYAGGRYEGIGADVYDYARAERERSPSASVREVYEVAADRLIGEIRAYDQTLRESQEEQESHGYRIHL